MQKIEIHTSCGKVIHQALSDMSERQLSGLIDQNSDNPEVHILRNELKRREAARTTNRAA